MYAFAQNLAEKNRGAGQSLCRPKIDDNIFSAGFSSQRGKNISSQFNIVIVHIFRLSNYEKILWKRYFCFYYVCSG